MSFNFSWSLGRCRVVDRSSNADVVVKKTLKEKWLRTI